MTSKTQKRKDSTEVSTASSTVASKARSMLSLLSVHRWKVLGAAIVAVAGILVGSGVVDVGKLSSGLMQYATPRTVQTAATPYESEPGDPPPVVAGATPADPSITPCFTPGENCTGLVVAAIDRAKSEILVQAYSLSRASVIDALGRARVRGVKVRVILDKADERQRTSDGSGLISQRILPQVDGGVEIAHSKVIVIDRDTVITSSFNFNAAAEKNNAENLLVITGHPDIAAAYRKNWERRLAASRPYYGTMAPVL